MTRKTRKLAIMPVAAPHKESAAWIRTIEEGKGYAAVDASLFRKLLGRITEYAFFRALRCHVRPGDTVLEVGCGWGVSSFALAGEGGVSVTALDIAEKLIADLRRLQKELGGSYATQLTLVTGDAFRLHEMGRTFDVVFSDGTYEHFLRDEDRRKFLEQVRAVLRNGGIFSVAVPNLHNPFFCSVVNPKMPAMYPFTLQLLAAELSSGGFRPLETGYSFVNPGFEQWVRSRWMVAGIRAVNALFCYLPRPIKGILAAHLYCVAQKT